MSAVGWRRAVHASHAGTTLALLASGALLQWPDLRAGVLGGYGRELALAHEAAGVAFVLIPLAALARAGRALLRDARRRLGPPDPFGWRKLHIASTLVAAPLLGATGLVLWLDEPVPLAVVDAALELHAALSWLLLGLLAIHLVAARRKMAGRVREMLGRGTPPPDDPDPLFGMD